MGVAYDVFGNGKTAIKVNLGKYLQAATNDENYWANNPASRIVDERRATAAGPTPTATTSSTATCSTRRRRTTWRPAATAARRSRQQPELRQRQPELDDRQPRDPGRLGRPSVRLAVRASVQQELLPRVSLEVGYNRRWFGNFFVTDNTLTTAADYDTVDADGPAESALPGGGGTAHLLRHHARGVGTRRAELPDVRNRLRAGAHAVLARRRRQPERAAARTAARSRRHDDRPWRAEHLRARRGAARAARSLADVNQPSTRATSPSRG